MALMFFSSRSGHDEVADLEGESPPSSNVWTTGGGTNFSPVSATHEDSLEGSQPPSLRNSAAAFS
jgi:hypothetical protein